MICCSNRKTSAGKLVVMLIVFAANAYENLPEDSFANLRTMTVKINELNPVNILTK